MRRGFPLLFLVLAACSRFGAESDLTPTPAPDAGTSAAADAGSDAGKPTTDPFACASGKPPMEAAALDFSAPPDEDWVNAGSGPPPAYGDANLVAGTWSGGAYAHVTFDHDTRFIERIFDLVPKSVRLEYDLAVAKLKDYAEFGCSLDLLGDGAADFTDFYLATKDTDALGVDYDYLANNVDVDPAHASEPVAAFVKGTWQHVVVDVRVDGRTVIAKVALGDGPPITVPNLPKTTFDLTRVRVSCGITYVENATAVDIGIDNVALRVCTP